MSYHGVFRRCQQKQPEDYDVPYCPVCGEECYTLYKRGGVVLGCDVCMEEVNAYQHFSDQEWEDNL